MTAAEIAHKLGGASRSGEWWRCRCPVHRGQSPSLALRDTATGLAVKCWAGCIRWQVMKEFARLGLASVRPQNERDMAAITEKATGERSRIANARDIWATSYGADETTQIDNYFHSRGITLPPPPTLRIRGNVYHSESDERRPAMVARVDHAERGHTAIHLTFLAIDGSCKATLSPNRKMIGVVAGGAVRLAPVDPGKWLVVGEGIESTLGAMELTGLPGWAALSAGGLERLILPLEARMVMIAADNDLGGRGEDAARNAAERWTKEGRRVRVAMPPVPGHDFNDVLLEGEAARHAG